MFFLIQFYGHNLIFYWYNCMCSSTLIKDKLFIHYNAKIHCMISDLPFTCNCSLLVKKRRLQPFSAASISSSGVMGVSLYLRQILSHSSHEWQSYVIQKGIDSDVSKLKEQRKIKFKSVLDSVRQVSLHLMNSYL